MEKPDVDISTLSPGKIFQIDPIGKDYIQVQYGGDFLVAVEYSERGVLGYLANIYDQGQIARDKGAAYLIADWKYLECVGSCFWFRKNEATNDEEKTSE